MQRIPLNYLKPGMVTAEEVRDEKGRVLCAPGTKVTPELIEKLVKMGVRFVTVEGKPVKFPWEKSLEEELRELEVRFSRAKHPFLLELKKAIEEFLRRELAEESAHVG